MLPPEPYWFLSWQPALVPLLLSLLLLLLWDVGVEVVVGVSAVALPASFSPTAPALAAHTLGVRY